MRALEADADMLLKPADADASFRGVVQAVKSGRITEQRVEESARRILAAKYDLGLVKERMTPVDSLDRSVGSKDVMGLATEIAEHAITLVRDEDKLLPLKNLKPDTRVFNLAVTNGEDRNWIANPFVASLNRAGVKVETVVVDERTTSAEILKIADRAVSADLIIVSLYGRVRSGQADSVGIPKTGEYALKRLILEKKPIVGISFGNPYLLQSFPKLRTYLVSYGDMPALQQAAARAVLGEIDVVGRLPISLPGLYPRGTGIQLKAAK